MYSAYKDHANKLIFHKLLMAPTNLTFLEGTSFFPDPHLASVCISYRRQS